MLDSKIPPGDLANKWSGYKSKVPLVSPANKQNIDVIVIGTGLAGASLSLIHISEPTRLLSR